MIDLSPQRTQFPALQQIADDGLPYVFFDGPGGTQVPQQVIDAIAHYYTHANANTHGQFLHSARTDVVIANARQAMADFLNAPSPDEIVFGPTSTNLAFNITRAIGATLTDGDEIIVTRLDHDANISPWLALRETGAVVKFIDVNLDDCTLNLEHYQSLLSPKTKWVALGYASNAVGTINPIQKMTEMAHAVGAKVWVDAVHFAPHQSVDVQALGCDVLMCSTYKFFGPHMGVVWGKYDLLDALPAYKVRPADDEPPHKFEQGTGNFEGMAGVAAAIDYLASVGEKYGQSFADKYRTAGFTGRGLLLKQAMSAISAYEQEMFKYFLAEMQNIENVKIYGITAEDRLSHRTPTLAFTKDGVDTAKIARVLGENNIFVWDGDYYAIEISKALGVFDKGGMVRVGLAHYNTRAEVDRLLNVVKKL